MFAYAKPEQKQATKSAVQKKDSEKVAASPNLTGIPDTMKTRFENLSGFSFGDVRVHYNSGKPAQLQALAYTQGNQVYVAPGQEKHLRHELGHVVQQKQGGVSPTGVRQNHLVNESLTLEREADSLAVEIERIGLMPQSVEPVQMCAENTKAQGDAHVIQLQPKPIGRKVYYGTAGNRARHLASDGGDTHKTVDTLNAAIGITGERLNLVSLGEKRVAVINALNNNENRQLSPDENAWRLFLHRERQTLLMPDLDSDKCLDDIGVKKKTVSQWIKDSLTGCTDAPPVMPHSPEAVGAGAGVAGDHRFDDYTTEQRQEHFSTDLYIVGSEIPLHKKYIEGAIDESIEARKDLSNIKIGKDRVRKIMERCLGWTTGIVMNKFWRITSTLGIDFFDEHKKEIVFVRRAGDEDERTNMGRFPITNSEWQYAADKGYIGGSVMPEEPY